MNDKTANHLIFSGIIYTILVGAWGILMMLSLPAIIGFKGKGGRWL